MFKISENYSIEQFCAILAGSEHMPDTWVTNTSVLIHNSLFMKKLAHDESESDRQLIITQIWEAIRESKNKLLILDFCESALGSKKTGEELAYRILFYLAKNDMETYKNVTDAKYGINLYSASVLRAINNYYKYGIQKVLDDNDNFSETRDKLLELIMN